MVVAGEEEAWLAMALRSARDSGITGRELRRLQWQAFEASVGRSGAGSVVVKEVVSGEDPLLLMDKCLAAVAKVAGLSGRLSVSQAKEVLRSRGAGRLASRIGDVSKYRNRAAHRDVGLPELILDEAAAFRLPVGAGFGCEVLVGDGAFPHMSQKSTATEFRWEELVTAKVKEAVDANFKFLQVEVEENKMDVDLLKGELVKIRGSMCGSLEVDLLKGELANLQLPVEAMRGQFVLADKLRDALVIQIATIEGEIEQIKGFEQFGISEKVLNEKFMCLERGLEAVRGSMCESSDISLLKGELVMLQLPVEALREQCVLADKLRDAMGIKIATIECEVAEKFGISEQVLNEKFICLEQGLEAIRGSMCESSDTSLLKGELVSLQLPVEAVRDQVVLADKPRDAQGIDEHKLDIYLLWGELAKLQAPIEAMGAQLGQVPALWSHFGELATEVKSLVGIAEEAMNEKFSFLEGRLMVADKMRDAVGYKVAYIEDEVAVLQELSVSLRPLVHRRHPAV
jgi:hypothetical protein